MRKPKTAPTTANDTVDVRVIPRAGRSTIAGMRDGNRLPSVPNLQFTAATSYSWRPVDNGDVAVEHASLLPMIAAYSKKVRAGAVIDEQLV